MIDTIFMNQEKMIKFLGGNKIKSSGDSGHKSFISKAEPIEDVGNKFSILEWTSSYCKGINKHPHLTKILWNWLVTAREISELKPDLKLLGLGMRVENGFKSKLEIPRASSRNNMAYDKFGERRKEDSKDELIYTLPREVSMINFLGKWCFGQNHFEWERVSSINIEI